MGIPNLLPAVEGAVRPCSLREFQGKIVAIDASIFICKALHSNANVTQSILQLVNKVKSFGIVPILVFDGEIVGAKRALCEKRERERELNRDLAAHYEETGNEEQALRYFKKNYTRSVAVVDKLKGACKNHHIRFIQSPYESDAQCAYLVRNNYADFVLSEDSDFIVYDCAKVVYKLSYGNGELYEQEKMEGVLGAPFNVNLFRMVCILIGCDYFVGGVYGIGVTGALRFYRSLEADENLESMKRKITKHFSRVKLDSDFDTNFKRAEMTFQFQVVVDPMERDIRPLTPLPANLNISDMEFVGDLDKANADVFYWDTAEDVAACKDLVLPEVGPVEKTWFCRDCQDEFGSSAELRSHREMAHPHLCDLCPKRFKTSQDKTRHAASHDDAHPFVCHICGSAHKWKTNLAKHLKRHENARTFICKTCNKGFNSKYVLVNHEKVHEDVKPYICETCHKTFKRGNELQAHAKIHGDSRPHICQICQHGFRTKSDLRRHESNHLTVLAFECDKCQKKFKSQHYLTQHKQIHAEVYLHVCGVCGKGCKTNSNLRSHERTHLARAGSKGLNKRTKDESHTCTTCGKVFGLKSHLLEHAKSHKD